MKLRNGDATPSSRSGKRRGAASRLVRRPFVVATFAMTADGKITTRDFAPVDFTSREDKAHLIRHRSLGDAVLIGHSTLKRDNVRLGIPREELRDARRRRGQSSYPLRVIVSNAGRIDAGLNIFQTDFGPILIFSTRRMPRETQARLSQKAKIHLSEGNEVDLARLLQTLARDYGVRTVACEGGAQLFRGLLERGLVDQLNLTIAPFLFGGKDAPTLTGISKTFFSRSVRCRLTDVRVVGEECFLTYRIGRKAAQPARLARPPSRRAAKNN
jgi:riboflavin-specific deaminase-like protein